MLLNVKILAPIFTSIPVASDTITKFYGPGISEIAESEFLPGESRGFA